MELEKKYISMPYQKEANLPQYSSVAGSRQVDFSKSVIRDDVSFYKNLARAEDARRYGLPLEDYEKMLRLAKSGKFKVDFKPVTEIN